MIHVQGTHFFITGKLAGMDARQASAKIFALGGHVSATVLPQVQVVLVGRGASEKRIKKAMGHGAIVLEGDAVDVLLRDGVLDPGEESTASLDELIGEARSLLAGRESERVWHALVGLVDRCVDAQLDDFVNYLEPQLARWKRDVTEVGWLGYALGELRVMPADWLTALLNGETSAKYRLVHGVSFVDSELGAKVASKLFDQHEQLPNLSTIQLDKKSLRKTLIAKLLDSELAPRLRHIGLPFLYKQPLELIEPIARSQRLANLETLVLSNAPTTFFEGEALQRLRRVGLADTGHVGTHAPKLGDLPELRAFHVNAGGFWDSDERIKEVMEAVIELLDTSQLSTLGITTTKSLALPDFFAAVSNTSAPLTRIDLTGIAELDCTQEVGATYWSGVLADTRFAREGAALVLNASFDQRVRDVLVGLGFDVWDLAPEETVGARPPRPMQNQTLPAGESERRTEREYCVEDAMLVSDDSEETWRIICGVMDALALQLEPEEFSTAATRIDAFIEHFSDATCKLPRRWFDLLYRQQHDPRLTLVRTLSVDYYDYGRNAKSSARHLTGLASAAQIEHIERLELHSFDAPKSVITALGDLVKASGVKQIALGNPRPQVVKKLGSELERIGSSARVEELEYSRSEPVLRASLTGGSARVERLEISTSDELAALVTSADVDEIVVLDIAIARDIVADELELDLANIPSPAWTCLRSLKVSWNSGEDIAHIMATWLANARPVVANARNLAVYAERGVLARAYASALEIALGEDTHAHWEMLGRDIARPGYLKLRQDRGAEPRDVIRDIVALSERVRERLRGLVLPLAPSAIERIPDLLAALPSLSLFVAECDQLEACFADVVEIFCQDSVGEHLGHFVPIDKSLFTPKKPPVLDAAKIKKLAKTGGLSADRWIDSPGRSSLIIER